MQRIKYIYTNRFKHLLESYINYTNCSFIDDLISLEGESLDKEYFEGTYIDFGINSNYISFVDGKTILKEFKKETNVDFEIWFNSKGENFWYDKTTEIKVGRFLKKMLGEVYDNEVQEFVLLYKAYHSSFDYKMEIVYGEDIIKYYNKDLYHIESKYSSLDESCMAYNTKSEKDAKKWGWTSIAEQLQFYAKNPNVGLLILRYKDSDKIKGRALIWTLKTGKKYIDIPYVDFDFDYNLYEKYALDNNCWYWKKHSENVMSVDTTEEIKSLFCSIGNKKAKITLPYLDTMEYNRKSNVIYK